MLAGIHSSRLDIGTRDLELDETLGLSAAQLAVLAELLLRGPQTVGELRGRASRMHPFDELAQVQAVLDELAARAPADVVRLPRQPGRKESRWAQLWTGSPVADADPDEAGPRPEPATLEVRAENERLAALHRHENRGGLDDLPSGQSYATLEETVADLQSEVAALRAELERFRQQFE